MIEFKIMPQHHSQLVEQDPEWIAGYFEVGEIDYSVCFFENRHCMIIPTLINLLEYLSDAAKYNGKRIDWHGEDNGNSVALFKQKGFLIFEASRFSTTFNINYFTLAVLQEYKRFIKNWIEINPSVLQNEVLIYLTNTVAKLSEK